MADLVKQQLMFSLIEVWKKGEQSQQQFCKQKELDYHQFQYWLRRYKQAQGLISEQKPAFSRITFREAIKATTLELVYPDGRKLIFHEPVEASFLRALLG
jgi:hypothetical protein